MQQWELIESAAVPDDGGFMRLVRRGDELMILVNGRTLMSNKMHGSEDALANLVFESLEKAHSEKQKEEPDETSAAQRILIGGMGMGFTLAAVLERAGPEAQVVVAELVEAVVRWNRRVLGEAAGRPVEDPRTSVYVGDVADMIRHPPEPWDAILLDVDNGPVGLTRSTNDWLYSWEGLKAASAGLRPGGVLGVWSAANDDGFTRMVRRVGFSVKVVPVGAKGAKGGARHVIWICTWDG